MHDILPPICFVVALAMLIAGFGLWAVGPPEPSVQLHQARVSGEEDATEVFEAHLLSQQRRHRWLMVALFGGSAVMVVTAFLAMRPARR